MVLEIKYIKNQISPDELEYIKARTPKRYAKCLEYKSLEERISSLISRIMICNNLSIDEDIIKYSELKKPYIKNGPYFNVSHSKEYTVFVKSENKIGIDIEYIDGKNIGILDYAFNKDEQDYILECKGNYGSTERLTKLWTIKESLFKASGAREYIEPKDIKVNCNNTIEFFDEVYNVYSFKYLDYIISVSSIIKYDDVLLVNDRIIY
jgi:4'-phosphopantetheinyl transferase